MNNDLISREALKKAIIEHRDDYIEGNFFLTKLFYIIDNAPTVSDRYNEGYAQGYIDGSTGADYENIEE